MDHRLWIVQGFAPLVTGKKSGRLPDGRAAFSWAAVLDIVPAAMALPLTQAAPAGSVLVTGLALFGELYAVNSSLHSYLIVSHASEDGVSLDVGFYYMAKAMGPLLGTVLSGWVFQAAGLAACLWWSCAFIALAAILSTALPRHTGIMLTQVAAGSDE